MNKTELKSRLIAEGIPSDMYYLQGGFPNEAYCLNDAGNFWEVYYSERGLKSGLKNLYNEEDACNYLYELIIKAQKK